MCKYKLEINIIKGNLYLKETKNEINTLDDIFNFAIQLHPVVESHDKSKGPAS